MNTENLKTYKIQSLLSVVAISAGVLMMTYMIVVEDEPGAIPLLLIAFGTLSYIYTRSSRKIRQA